MVVHRTESVREIACSAAQNAAGLALYFVRTLVTLSIAGSNNHLALAGVGLGISTQTFAIAPAIGIISAFDTLVSTAHGAGDHRQACAMLGQVRLVLLALVLLLATPLAFTGHILVALGVDAPAARLAGEYNRAALVGFIFQAEFLAGRRFLSNLCQPRLALLSGMVALAFHVPATWLLVGSYGVLGAGYSTALCNVCAAIGLDLLLVLRAPQLGIQRRWLLCPGLTEWYPILTTGFAGLLQTCGEFWVFEILTMLSGRLGPADLAACVVAMNTATVLRSTADLPGALQMSSSRCLNKITMNSVTVGYLMACGVGATASALVGRAVGNGDAGAARSTAMRCVGCYVGFWLPLACACIWVGSGSALPALLPALGIYAVAALFDGVQVVLAGVLRAAGCTGLTAGTYTVVYYLWLLPLSITFAFPCRLGTAGLWAGYLCGAVLTALIFLRGFRRLSFARACEKARQRLQPTLFDTT